MDADNAAAAPNAAAPGSGNEVSSVMREEVVAESEEPARPTPPPPPQPQNAVVQFAEQGADLGEEARAKLDALLPAVVGRGDLKVMIRGHSDSQGSDRANRRSSERRARAVRDYLLDKGVAAERITLVALGETRPVAPNAHPDGSDFPEGRARNRRVEVELVAPDLVAPAPAAPAPTAR